MRNKGTTAAFFVCQYVLALAFVFILIFLGKGSSYSLAFLLVSASIMLLLLFFLVWFYDAFERALVHEEQLLFVKSREKQLDKFAEESMELEAYAARISHYRHDLRNQLQVIQALQDQGKLKEALEYLDRLIERAEQIETFDKTAKGEAYE